MSTEETDTPQTPDGDTPRPRRRSPLAVVSVAAAVLVAGGGGAYWASTAADGSGARDPGRSGNDGSPKPLALDAYASAGHEGIAPGEPDPRGGRYVATGKLPDGPGSAPVYLTDAKVAKADVARLAKALDVPGSPRADHGFWKVGGAPDARGPVLRVSQDGPGGWSYSRYGSPGGTSCVRPPDAGPDAATGAADASRSDRGDRDSGGDKSCPSYRGGETGKRGDGGKGGDKAVSEAKAKRVAEPVLKALGLSDAKLDARGLYGAVRMVNAEPRVGDLPTHGWMTSLQIAADGRLVGGSGSLSTPKEDDSYPLIGADAALKRLNAAVKGADCASAKPDKGGRESGGSGKGSGESGEIAPCEPDPSGPSDKVTVRKATFGLAAHMVDGRRALVPSWIFETRPTGTNGVTATVPYPAVKPEFIKKAGGGTETPGHSPSSKPGGKPKKDDIRSYRVDGKTLTLRFWGGVCNTYSVSAEETSKQVTVEIKSKPKQPGRACILIAKQLEKKVTLEEPLDGRKVVDKSTGETVPRQK